MFDILKLPSQDSHLQEFEARQAEALRDGNDRDASHWGAMANAEKIIAESGQNKENQELKGR